MCQGAVRREADILRRRARANVVLFARHLGIVHEVLLVLICEQGARALAVLRLHSGNEAGEKKDAPGNDRRAHRAEQASIVRSTVFLKEASSFADQPTYKQAYK